MLLSRYRSWIFSLFVVLFGATASVVLFYAFGYRYSFERGIFIFSGSITIKTIPENVAIQVDGELVPEKRLGLLNNSVHIAGLMPGEHTLRLTAPDHHAWEKKVVVESGISREFWNIILPRLTYDTTPLLEDASVVKIFPSPSNETDSIFIKEQANELSLVLFDYSTKIGRQIFSLPESSFDRTGEENLEWSWFDNGRYIILPVERQGKHEHLVIDSRDGSYFSLEERSVMDNIHLVRWNTETTNELLFLSDTTLYRLSLAPDSAALSVGEDVITYSLADDTLFVVTKSGEVWRVDGNRLVTVTPAIPFGEHLSLTLTVYDRNRLALLEKDGERRLFVLYPNPNTVEPVSNLSLAARGVKTMQFSNDGKKLLYATDYEIGVIFTSDWDVQPRRNAGDQIQVARFSEKISNVQWAENYEHILFTRGETLKFIELDGRDRRIIADIKTFTASPSEILARFSSNQFLVVVPGQSVQVLTFPESQTLFGQ